MHRVRGGASGPLAPALGEGLISSCHSCFKGRRGRQGQTGGWAAPHDLESHAGLLVMIIRTTL